MIDILASDYLEGLAELLIFFCAVAFLCAGGLLLDVLLPTDFWDRFFD